MNKPDKERKSLKRGLRSLIPDSEPVKGEQIHEISLDLIDPNPTGFKPLASAELLEPGENWAPIALVDGKLLIRDQKNLKCVAVVAQ